MTYKIVRFFRDQDRQKIIETGLTLHEAQTYCQFHITESDFWEDSERSEDNPEGPGVVWFDGYTKEESEDEDVTESPIDSFTIRNENQYTLDNVSRK
jgi:hypothetical protein